LESRITGHLAWDDSTCPISAFIVQVRTAHSEPARVGGDSMGSF